MSSARKSAAGAPRAHLPIHGMLTVGGWSIDVFVEQRYDLARPAEDVFVTLIAGQVRLAVVDPALNAMLPGRETVAARAWGRVTAALRSHDNLHDALAFANSDIFDADAGWMGGPMLCVAAVDLHPREPLVLSAARAGDTEIHWDSGALRGPCFTPEALERLNASRTASGHVGPDPRRWAVQAETLALSDYLSTPLGLTDRPRLETWGPARSDVVTLATDGAVSENGSVVAEHGALLGGCVQPATPPNSFPHGDRAVISARWVG